MLECEECWSKEDDEGCSCLFHIQIEDDEPVIKFFSTPIGMFKDVRTLMESLISLYYIFDLNYLFWGEDPCMFMEVMAIMFGVGTLKKSPERSKVIKSLSDVWVFPQFATLDDFESK